MTTQFMDLHDISEHTGLSLHSIRKYHNTAQQRRETGETRPGDFPPPDAIIGSRPQWSSPGWKPATINTWQNNRPRATPRT